MPINPYGIQNTTPNSTNPYGLLNNAAASGYGNLNPSIQTSGPSSSFVGPKSGSGQNVNWLTGSVWSGGPNQGFAGEDPDEAALRSLGNEEAQARAGLNHGVDFTADNALMNMYQGRVNLKNTLGKDIQNNTGLLSSQLDQDYLQGNQAIGQGIRNTRANYASRGLLFSGLEQGAEQQVRGAGALATRGQEASDVSQAQQAQTQYEALYNSVDLNSQAQNNELATQAMQIGLQNQTARAQAMQQLGTGLGEAIGTAASWDSSKAPKTTNKDNGGKIASTWGYDPSNPQSWAQTANDYSLDNGGQGLV